METNISKDTLMYNPKQFTPAITRGRLSMREVNDGNDKVVPRTRLFDNDLGHSTVHNENPFVNSADTLPYKLNKSKALDKKLAATARESTCTMTGGGLSIKLSTAHYEAFRSAIPLYIDTQPDLCYTYKDRLDENSMVVHTLFTISHDNKKLYVLQLLTVITQQVLFL